MFSTAFPVVSGAYFQIIWKVHSLTLIRFETVLRNTVNIADCYEKLWRILWDHNEMIGVPQGSVSWNPSHYIWQSLIFNFAYDSAIYLCLQHATRFILLSLHSWHYLTWHRTKYRLSTFCSSPLLTYFIPFASTMFIFSPEPNKDIFSYTLTSIDIRLTSFFNESLW